jgi:hypothetical protein
MPRSGIWMVRSKSDRRWKLRGQYASSGWWNPPASGWPPEAIDAVAQLQRSLGGNPPEDLSCIFLPYPTGKLKRLFNSSVLSATERQVALHCLTQESGLSILGLDRDRGEVCFGKPGHEPVHRFSAQAMGMLDDESSHWQWAWVAEATASLNACVLNSAKTLREYGTKHEVAELTYDQIALGIENDRPWFNAGYLSKIACRLCDADFVIAGGTPERPNLKELWLVTAPGALPQPKSVAMRVFYVIKEALETWGPGLAGSRPRKAIEAYAQERGCTVRDWDGRAVEWAPRERQVIERRIRIDDPSGDSLNVDFDESGDISGMGHPPPRVQKQAEPSWLKRLLGQGKGRK